MDVRATHIEVTVENFQFQQQIVDLNDLALALVGGGVGEIAVG